jgi:DDE superfamily endonuclease
MMKSAHRWTSGAMWSVCGASGFSMSDCQGSKSDPGRAAPRFSPPEVVVQVKAIACELPATLGVPLSRLSSADIVREAQRSGIVATLSDKTVWRWLHEDAIRPWQHRTWIFPRDPQFISKAGPILDLYARHWEGCPLRDDEFVLSADEKTSIQARIRKHASLPPRPGQPARVEHEYARGGAWAYLAAMDVHRAKFFGRCEQSTGIEPFNRLVTQVMMQPPYRDARRVFWIMDNGSSHRGQPCVRRLKAAFPNLVPVHGPIHASWLNQIEIYFSIVERKALTPNDFSSLEEVENRLLGFQQYYENIAAPFEWKFTRDNLKAMMRKLHAQPTPLCLAA